MTRGIDRHASHLCRVLPLIAICLATFAPRSASADFVFNVQDVIYSAGATGASLDILFTNTGPTSVTIGGFSFELTVGNTAITFQDVTTGTSPSPYIFGSLGLSGPSIGTVVTGQDIMASDLDSFIDSGTTVASGQTVGLGHLLFDVAGNAAAGTYAVSLVGYPASSLSDPFSNNIPITSLNDGSITIQGQGVPEPASMVLL